jgi:hypothetical protein
MHTEQPAPDAEDRRESAEIDRRISERNREDAEEHRSTMETLRQVAEAKRETREYLRESTRTSERQTAEDNTQFLLQRMDDFEEQLSQLTSRLISIEALLKSLQEQLQQRKPEK